MRISCFRAEEVEYCAGAHPKAAGINLPGVGLGFRV